jgi:hypothetical protein
LGFVSAPYFYTTKHETMKNKDKRHKLYKVSVADPHDELSAAGTTVVATDVTEAMQKVRLKQDEYVLSVELLAYIDII